MLETLTGAQGDETNLRGTERKPSRKRKDVGWTGDAIRKHRPCMSVRAVGSLGEPEGSGGKTGEWNWPRRKAKKGPEPVCD